jgi:hypothetical protein
LSGRAKVSTSVRTQGPFSIYLLYFLTYGDSGQFLKGMI